MASRLGGKVKRDWCYVDIPDRLLIASAMLLAITAVGAGQQIPPTIARTHLSLELRLGGGRTQFHLGEIIPVALTYTSPEHSDETIAMLNCYDGSEFQYHVEPPVLVDRSSETDVVMGMSCGPVITTYTGEKPFEEKPFKVEEILNNRFRIDVPGKYRITVTWHGVGLPVTSNTVDLEILPNDGAWQKTELERALTLIASPQRREEGCRILRFLETNDAEIAMARLYTGRSNCDSTLRFALISAKNRKAVLDLLEAGLGEPERPISTDYLRTIAIVSLYQQHPDWYPAPGLATDSQQAKLLAGSPMRSGLWRERGTLPNQEIYYAKLLVAALPGKAPAARAQSQETLLYLGRTLGYVEIPAEILNAVRDGLPSVFRSLPPGDQNYILRVGWPELESRAMIPVLKEVVDAGFVPASNWPQSIALRRLHELAPEEARPYILRELRAKDPHIEASVLGLLPEKELPELDGTMLDRVKQQRGDGFLANATALVQRYASPAIAQDLRPLLVQNIGNMECESEANLLAYFLRVAPDDGKRMLGDAMRARGWRSCHDNLLTRLARIRMSPEVEDAAIVTLDDSDTAVVQEGLEVLREYGSVNCRASILRHFRQWHEEWQARAKELDNPENWQLAQLDSNYFSAAAFAQAWISSEEDLQALASSCLTESCKQQANSAVIESSHKHVMIGAVEPVGDEVAKRFYPGGNMDRMKQKLAQYPKGTVFWIDARFMGYDAVHRLLNELKPWTADHGYVLQVYHD